MVAKKRLAIAAMVSTALLAGVFLFISCGETKRVLGPDPAKDTTATDTLAGAIHDTLFQLPDTIDFADSLTTIRLAVTSSPRLSFDWNTIPWGSWLFADPESGKQGDSITLTVDRSSPLLTRGLNTTRCLFSASESAIQSKAIFVKVQVVTPGEPKLSIPSEVTYRFGHKLDSMWLNIRNSGAGKLNWTVSSRSSWLTLSDTLGSFDASVKMVVNRRGLDEGFYIDTLTITSNGGNLVIPVTMQVLADTTTKHLRDYWPMSVGNTWVMLSHERNSWWAYKVIDSFAVDTTSVWKMRVDVSDGSWGEFWFFYKHANLWVTGDQADLTHLYNLSAPNCTMIDCWTSGSSFPLFPADIRPGVFTDPYWRTKGEWVQGSMDMLLGQFPVWLQGMMSPDSFPAGARPDCAAMKEVGHFPDSVYTLFAKGIGMVIWDGYTLVQAIINGVTYGEVPLNLESTHFAVNSDTLSPVLYWLSGDNGERITFTGSRTDSGMPLPKLVTYEVDNTVKAVFVIRPDFTPMLCALEDMTLYVDNRTEDGTVTPFDLRQAQVTIIAPTTDTIEVINMRPDNPYAVLDSMEYFEYNRGSDLVFDGPRGAMEDAGIETWEDLLAWAWIKGENQARWQIIATLIGISGFLSGLEGSGEIAELSKTSASTGLGIQINPEVRNMANKIGEYIKDELACKYCVPPGVPAVQMLQCQGVKAVVWSGQVCHNSYMLDTPIMRCLDRCIVSMKCFTNICMPRQVALSDVDAVLFENNLSITDAEVRDLVQQNIDTIKGIFGLSKSRSKTLALPRPAR